MSDTGATAAHITAPTATNYRNQRRWLLALTVTIPLAYAVFFLLTWDRVGPKDFDQFLVFHQLQYWNQTLFGFAKQWTPLLCAGLSMAGEPQIPVMSLSMLLTYLVGPLLGIKFACIAYLVVGWLGAYLYAGVWRRETLTRMLAASLFIGNGFFVYRLAIGHIDFVPFLILPAALWSLHKTLAWQRSGSVWASAVKAAVFVSAYAIVIAMAVDGSPVAIIHLLLWICLYALVLSYHAHSFTPAVTLSCAMALAAVLDAGYLWPMLAAQAEFPRHTADIFTDPTALLLHAVVPLRGKITHGSGKGHELTVFIGPVLAMLIWRYRASLFASLPRAMFKPLLVVSLISVLLGMGSLRLLHIPPWLSPFDLLRPLPGFRSIGVTARYWGFLALPLSLLGAVALRQFVTEAPAQKVTLWLSLVLLLQLAPQAEAFWSQWHAARPYRGAELQNYFNGRPETLSYVATPERRLQGEFITPRQGVANCYDMDDFIHAPMKLGTVMEIAAADYLSNKTADGMVSTILFAAADRAVLAGPLLSDQRIGRHGGFAAERTEPNLATTSMATTTMAMKTMTSREATQDIANMSPSYLTQISFVTWSHLHLQDKPSAATAGVRVIVLNQAWNSHWSAAGCQILRGPSDRLALRCDTTQLRRGVELLFADPISSVAANLSLHAWRSMLIFLATCLVITAVGRQRWQWVPTTQRHDAD